MIWQNPIAWLGLGALAIPIIIHLLNRRSARIQRFPTLRFFAMSPVLAPRRRQLSELLLLAVRMLILLAAVAALARPVFDPDAPRRDGGRAVARAVIVDTSASMARVTSLGASARDVARADAERLADSATTGVVIESASPARALAGAVEWLRSQPGRRVLHVLSDFQLGALDSAEVASVPGDVAVNLRRVAVAPGAMIAAPRMRSAEAEVTARASLVGARTSVEWIPARNATPTPVDSIELFAGARDRARATAAQRASRAVGAPAAVTPRPIAVVFAGYESRDEVLRNAALPNQPWMGDVIAYVRSDATLSAAAADAALVDSGAYDARFTALARTDYGRPVALAARAQIDGRDRLVLMPLADAGSLVSAALMNAALRALGTDVPGAELEPRTLADDVIARWQRPTTVDIAASDVTPGDSDGRWFWIVALALLGAETLVRRARTTSGVPA